MQRNPFKPTAGANPPQLIGRQDVVDEFVESIEDGPGAPGRLTLLTGARGVGKTVLLNELADRVAMLGWLTIAETATPGMASRIADAAARRLAELDTTGRGARAITGVGVAAVGSISLDRPEKIPAGLREHLTWLLDELEKHGSGLLITVDEVHSSAIDELRSLTTVVQHLVREDREIALAMAGLRSSVSDLLNDAVLTFMRRAHRVELTNLAVDDVAESLAKTFADTGRTITAPALEQAAEASRGYPFMVQLVGYQCWRRATDGIVDAAVVTDAVPVARRRLDTNVHEAALADLSDGDRQFLVAMAEDDGSSRTGEIAVRLGREVRYASVYRARLIEAGVIEPTSYGMVDFTIPYLREYLRSQRREN